MVLDFSPQHVAQSSQAEATQCQSEPASQWDYLIQPHRVHRKVYTDPGIFQMEMSKIFGGTWVYVAHESEIPQPDDFKTGLLGHRPIITLRDHEGQLRVLFNRCLHRGATLCRQDQGSAKAFICPYHGWTYTNDGHLAGIPWPKPYGSDFDRSPYHLHQARVESYRGFIFATLNPEMPPLQAHLGRAADLLDQWLDRYPGGQVTLQSAAHRPIYSGNWKFAYDNAADGYHVNFSHRSLLVVASRLGEEKDMQYFTHSPDDSPMYVQDLGNGHIFLDQRPSYDHRPGAFWDQQRPQPGREAYEQAIRDQYGEEADQVLDWAIGAQMNLSIFPNLLIVGNQVESIQPLAVDRTQLNIYATTAEEIPDEVNTLRMRTQEDFPAFGNSDDMINFAECQRGLSVPEVEWVACNRGDGRPELRRIQDGVLTGPVTDELPIQGYYREWKRLMQSDIRLTTFVDC